MASRFTVHFWRTTTRPGFNNPDLSCTVYLLCTHSFATLELQTLFSETTMEWIHGLNKVKKYSVLCFEISRDQTNQDNDDTRTHAKCYPPLQYFTPRIWKIDSLWDTERVPQIHPWHRRQKCSASFIKCKWHTTRLVINQATRIRSPKFIINWQNR